MRKWMVAALIALTALAVRADERILDFTSEILINPDSTMTVKETLRVRAEGRRIKRGIYREFPTDYVDRAGNRVRVRFDVISVKRDGFPIAWSTKRLSNGWRVYMGSMNQTIPPGEYTFELTYQTDRQLGYFKNHDELYWNVTGLDWAFPIDHVKAVVILPDGAQAMEASGYTGQRGSKEQDVTVSTAIPTTPVFETTRVLAPQEGLTIVVTFPKGFVHEPTREEKVRMILSDNRNLVEGGVGLVILLVYYLLAWFAVGRDPAAGPIVPLYEPPDNLSPAAMRFIEKMGFDKQAMSAAMVDLAVRGKLTIKEEDGDYTLVKKDDNVLDLPPEEQKLFVQLLGTRHSIELDNKNATRMQKALKAFRNSLKGQFEKKYFNTNSVWFFPGILISIVTLAMLVIHSAEPGGAGFMTIWLSFWSIGVFALVGKVVASWRDVFRGKLISIFPAVFLTLFSLPFLAAEGFGIYMLGRTLSYPAVGILLAVALVNVVFYQLLKAPTLFGRQVMDRIEGFKLFLSVSEKDELAFRHPVDKTPETFERFLPYALALDVENQWAERFADALRTDLPPEEGGYRPHWYHGAAWSTLGTTGFASGLSSSFSSAVSSSTVSPGSSSGSGGGGFSGGGGGGGGGGF